MKKTNNAILEFFNKNVKLLIGLRYAKLNCEKLGSDGPLYVSVPKKSKFLCGKKVFFF